MTPHHFRPALGLSSRSTTLDDVRALREAGSLNSALLGRLLDRDPGVAPLAVQVARDDAQLEETLVHWIVTALPRAEGPVHAYAVAALERTIRWPAARAQWNVLYDRLEQALTEADGIAVSCHEDVLAPLQVRNALSLRAALLDILLSSPDLTHDQLHALHPHWVGLPAAQRKAELHPLAPAAWRRAAVERAVTNATSADLNAVGGSPEVLGDPRCRERLWCYCIARLNTLNDVKPGVLPWMLGQLFATAQPDDFSDFWPVVAFTAPWVGGRVLSLASREVIAQLPEQALASVLSCDDVFARTITFTAIGQTADLSDAGPVTDAANPLVRAARLSLFTGGAVLATGPIGPSRTT